jgi:hypothetical protein
VFVPDISLPFAIILTMRKILEGKNKATPKTIKIILDAIRSGASQRDASALAGISEDTLSLWKRQDSDFSEQMRQKEIGFKTDQVKIIQKAAQRSWQAAAWLLERKYPNEYTNRVRIEQSEPIKTGYEHLTNEEIKTKLQELRRRNGLVNIPG